MKPATRKRLEHVQLPSSKGLGFDTKKQRWYLSYKEKGKLAREFMPKGFTEEEARAEKDRRFTELAMLGAQVVERMKPIPMPGKKLRLEANYGIYRVEIQCIRYSVIVQGKYLGKFKTKEQAAIVRDAELTRLENYTKPCALCGKEPVSSMTGAKRTRFELRHEEEGCPNKIVLKRVGKTRILEAWNKVFWEGKAPTPATRNMRRDEREALENQ